MITKSVREYSDFRHFLYCVCAKAQRHPQVEDTAPTCSSSIASQQFRPHWPRWEFYMRQIQIIHYCLKKKKNFDLHRISLAMQTGASKMKQLFAECSLTQHICSGLSSPSMGTRWQKYGILDRVSWLTQTSCKRWKVALALSVCFEAFRKKTTNYKVKIYEG